MARTQYYVNLHAYITHQYVICAHSRVVRFITNTKPVYVANTLRIRIQIMQLLFIIHFAKYQHTQIHTHVNQQVRASSIISSGKNISFCLSAMRLLCSSTVCDVDSIVVYKRYWGSTFEMTAKNGNCLTTTTTTAETTTSGYIFLSNFGIFIIY